MYYVEIFYYKNDNYSEIIQNTKNEMLLGLDTGRPWNLQF